MMLGFIAKFLAKMWSINDNDNLPKNFDSICLVAHGATEERITYGAMSVACKVMDILSRKDVSCQTAFGSFSGNKNPEIEEIIKTGIFVEFNPGLPLTTLGPVLSTIEECLAFKRYFTGKSVVVVTDEAHSRRCKIVWKTLLPKTDIYVVSVPLIETIDKESPMTPYHNIWTALLFQALPTPFFWYLSIRGPEYMARWATKLHQPIQ